MTEPRNIVPVVEGTGNVFEDIGLEMSEKDMLKVHIALEINRTIQKRGLNQIEAARIMELDQSKVSRLLRGRLDGLSERKLIDCFLNLGRDMEIRFPDRQHSERGQIKIRQRA